MVAKKPLILICDDDRSLCEILENALVYDGYHTEIVYNGKNAIDRIKQNHHDLVLLDLKLPDISGLEILKQIQALEFPPLAVIISGQGDIHAAVEATKHGAFDFLEKPLDSNRVLVTIRNALDKGRLEKEKANLLQSVVEQYRMVGKSEALKRVHQFIEKAARTNSKVFIEGENGTGKELAARAIHHQSDCAFGPFMAVNCAAIPENLIESELFGHKKGSFTGAIADKPGRFQLADNGTIFLDEIGDMSLMMQAKVLRTLEEGVVEMVGGNESITVDVRVIAATNKNLTEEMHKGNFREDLYFRLNVLNIKMPSLRERKEDIPLLIEYFIEVFSHEYGIRIRKVQPRAMEKLLLYSWPGNVRELKNVVEKMVVLLDSSEIRPKDIEMIMNDHIHKTSHIEMDLSLKAAKRAFERQYIYNQLVTAGWNVTKTARLLRIPRTYLHKKINQLKIRHDADESLSA
ncbi:sigma-54-dependent Fis family transcriptional regulator [bacterium]|nr:sigma-54-dependent Fis family transcriptional regulator [bacterium]